MLPLNSVESLILCFEQSNAQFEIFFSPVLSAEAVLIKFAAHDFLLIIRITLSNSSG